MGQGGWSGSTIGVLCVGLGIFLSACVVSPALPVQEPTVNKPPVIHDDQVLPTLEGTPAFHHTISRAIEPTEFEVLEFHDENPNENLRYVWYSVSSEGDVSYLDQGFAAPQSDSANLYEDIYYRYDGASFTLDPCLEDNKWTDDNYVLWLMVTDGEPVFDAGNPPNAERGKKTLRAWQITLEKECPF